MKCALKLQVPEKIEDAVQRFIENPYFLRPHFLPSGRATSETSRGWRIEDSIDDTKGVGNWRSVEDRINKRKREGRKRRKLLGKHSTTGEELSYLTVSCDFLEDQENPCILPEKEWANSVDRGLHFQELVTKLPIEGPMTLEEAQQIEEHARKIKEWEVTREERRVILKPPKPVQAWKQWTPRRIEEDIELEEQVPVKAVFEGVGDGDIYDWVLRKGMEWDDFRFLTNSKLGHGAWEAYYNNAWWDGAVFNG
jgi:hypothetical protein